MRLTTFRSPTLKQKRSFALVAQFLLICAFGMSSQHSFATGLEQFKQFIQQNKTARGDFTQQQVSIKNGTPKVTKTQHGNFIFARPGKFVWTYQKPFEQVLQSDGLQLYLFDKELNQVTIKTLDKALGSSPAAVIFGATSMAEIEKNFFLKEGQQKQGMEWVEVTPKSKDTQFDYVGVGMQDNMPVALELRDALGSISLLSFKNIERNPPLKSDQFKFVIPQGAEVSRQ